MGLWKPGDTLPPSLQEMLNHFKLRGVKPVAYVYPILAFLAGTLPGGASPEWIVRGTYGLGNRLSNGVDNALDHVLSNGHPPNLWWNPSSASPEWIVRGTYAVGAPESKLLGPKVVDAPQPTGPMFMPNGLDDALRNAPSGPWKGTLLETYAAAEAPEPTGPMLNGPPLRASLANRAFQKWFVQVRRATSLRAAPTLPLTTLTGRRRVVKPLRTHLPPLHCHAAARDHAATLLLDCATSFRADHLPAGRVHLATPFPSPRP